jgi:hypothetical protein
MGLPSAAQAGEVRLTMQGGRVTLVARDATLRQILTEWAKVGQTRIVNMERVPGGPVSLELKDVPEAAALATILRTVGGYMAAPRRTADASLSRFDRIVVMPTLAPTTQAAASRPAPQAPSTPGRFPGSAGPGGMGPGGPGRFPGRPGADPSITAEDPADDEILEDEEEEDDTPPEDMDEPPAPQPVGLRQPGMMPPSNEPPAHPTSAYDPSGFGRTGGQPPTQPSLRPIAPPGAAAPGMITPTPAAKPAAQPPKPPGLPN